MSTIMLYTFEGPDGCEETYTTFSSTEAKEHGRKYNLLVIEREYEYSDSEPAWDFRREGKRFPVAGPDCTVVAGEVEQEPESKTKPTTP